MLFFLFFFFLFAIKTKTTTNAKFWNTWLVGMVLWHINFFRLFNAKSIFIQIVSSISKNSGLGLVHSLLKTFLFQSIQFCQTILSQTIQFKQFSLA